MKKNTHYTNISKHAFYKIRWHKEKLTQVVVYEQQKHAAFSTVAHNKFLKIASCFFKIFKRFFLSVGGISFYVMICQSKLPVHILCVNILLPFLIKNTKSTMVENTLCEDVCAHKTLWNLTEDNPFS